MEDTMMTKSELLAKLREFDGHIIAAGDAAADLVSSADDERITPAPAHLRSQLASGICMSAADKEGKDPDEIDALYMQITKAEKDLLEKR